MLSASLPPLRFRTIRFRVRAPCARARSPRNSGAANVTVNAATPPFTNSRRVTLIPRLLSGRPELVEGSLQLILRRTRDQMDEARSLRLHLRVAARPRAGCRQVVEPLGGHRAVGRRRGEFGDE